MADCPTLIICVSFVLLWGLCLLERIIKFFEFLGYFIFSWNWICLSRVALFAILNFLLALISVPIETVIIILVSKLCAFTSFLFNWRFPYPLYTWVIIVNILLLFRWAWVWHFDLFFNPWWTWIVLHSFYTGCSAIECICRLFDYHSSWMKWVCRH